MPQRKRSHALSRDLEHRVSQSRGDVRHRLLADAFEPTVRLDERDVDLPRVLRHRRGWIVVEVALDSPAFFDRHFLVHGVSVAKRDLSFDLFAHREWIDEAEAFVEGDIHTMQTQLALGAYRNRMHLRANRAGASLRPAPVINRNATRPPVGQLGAPS